MAHGLQRRHHRLGDLGGGLDKLKARDELYEQAIDIVLREGRGSVSLLQRALGIGYGRAARLIDFSSEIIAAQALSMPRFRSIAFTPASTSFRPSLKMA